MLDQVAPCGYEETITDGYTADCYPIDACIFVTETSVKDLFIRLSITFGAASHAYNVKMEGLGLGASLDPRFFTGSLELDGFACKTGGTVENDQDSCINNTAGIDGTCVVSF